MKLLIDGYNLLHASDVFASVAGPPTLARTREALLAFLAKAIESKWRKLAVIVFDAAQAPPGLPSELRYEEMTIRFAPRKSFADDLLEELIEAEREPKQLLVVSSDHRVQRAARQRGADYVDSEIWFAEQTKRMQASAQQTSEASSPREQPGAQTAAEIAEWTKRFGG